MAREQLLRKRGRPFGQRPVGRLAAIAVHRPSAVGGTRRRDRNGVVRAWRRARSGRAQIRAQRVQRVVGHQPLPDERPQRVDGLLAGTRRRVTRAAARRTPRRRPRAAAARRARRPASSGSASRGGKQARQVIGQVERDAAVAIAERLDADPRHLARAEQRVELRRRVVGDARRQDLVLEERGDERHALQLLDRVEQRVEPAARAADAVPRGEESAEHGRLDRLDLLSQPRQRSSANACAALRHRTTRVRARPAGTRLRPCGPRPSSRAKRGFDRREREAEPRRDVAGGKRPVRARVALDQIAERIGRPARAAPPAGPRAAECPAHRDSARRARRRRIAARRRSASSTARRGDRAARRPRSRRRRSAIARAISSRVRSPRRSSRSCTPSVDLA